MAAAVLAAHALLGAGLWTMQLWQDRHPAPRDPPLLWLSLPTGPTRPPPPEEPQPPSTRPAATVAPRPFPRTPAEPQAITATPVPASEPTAALPSSPNTPTARTEPVATAASAPPLKLDLPRDRQAAWRQRHPGLDDPRANSTRRSLEASIAAVLGGVEGLVEERLADGSVRFRRGTACVIARPSRAQALDPFNASVSPKPRPVEPC